MKRVEEHEVFAAAVGMQLNRERLGALAIHNGKGSGEYADCEEFVVGVLTSAEEGLIKRFRITAALTERWGRSGIVFRVYLFVRNGILVGGHIFKYKGTARSGHLRPAGYAVSPTQQEIRLAGRILDYLSDDNG